MPSLNDAQQISSRRIFTTIIRRRNGFACREAVRWRATHSNNKVRAHPTGLC
jgi:hypothetical protein